MFSSFSNLPTCKKTGPQRKKDAHGPSLHIGFLSKCHFWYGIYHNLLTVSRNPTFLNYCHILIIVCISDSNMGDPKLLLLFQNRILISKLEPYPTGYSYWIRDSAGPLAIHPSYWIGYRIGYRIAYWIGYRIGCRTSDRVLDRGLKLPDEGQWGMRENHPA